MEQMPRLTIKIMKVDNGYIAEFLDPRPVIEAAQEAMQPEGPVIQSDDDIDRTIDSMIAFNRHMHSEMVGENWKDDSEKRTLVREGFKLSFPHFFEKKQPHACLLMAQSFVFLKIEDLVKFLKGKLA